MAHMALIMGYVVLRYLEHASIYYSTYHCHVLGKAEEFCNLESKWNALNECKNVTHFFFHYVSNDPATPATVCCF